MCDFNSIAHNSLHHDMYIATMWRCALVSCTRSQSIGLVLGVCVVLMLIVSLCVHFANSAIECYFIIMVATIIGIFMAMLLILIYTFGLFVIR